jgi:hypothetical protein
MLFSISSNGKIIIIITTIIAILLPEPNGLLACMSVNGMRWGELPALADVSFAKHWMVSLGRSLPLSVEGLLLVLSSLLRGASLTLITHVSNVPPVVCGGRSLTNLCPLACRCGGNIMVLCTWVASDGWFLWFQVQVGPSGHPGGDRRG